jgi:hypothetical protein
MMEFGYYFHLKGRYYLKNNFEEMTDNENKTAGKLIVYRLFTSRSGGIRTHDLQHPMLARYQATLHPEADLFSDWLAKKQKGSQKIKCKTLDFFKFLRATNLILLFGL